MDSIDKWLKSLRLHKYTHLFKTMTYEQMLGIDEKYLIDLDITKGARNKILVSVKKLNLRPRHLMNMIDDLDQGEISMKEALTVLKEMLITPIPHPYETGSSSPSSLSSSTATSESAFEDLTYLFVDTFGRLVRRSIEGDGVEDSACHGIMTDIVDECLKHNSFTHEQKAKMARHKQRIVIEQKAKLARTKHRFQQIQLQPQLHQQHFMREQQQHQLQRAKAAGFSKQQQQQQQQQQAYHIPSRLQNSYHHELKLAQTMYNHNDHYYQHEQQQQQQQQHYQSFVNSSSSHHYHYQSNQFHHSHAFQHSHHHIQQQQQPQHQNQQQLYGEYSLLGPGKTFELPCLRAMAERSSRKS